MLANRVSGRGVVKILNRCPNTNASSSVGLEIKVKEFFRLANWSVPNMTSAQESNMLSRSSVSLYFYGDTAIPVRNGTLTK